MHGHSRRFYSFKQGMQCSLSRRLLTVSSQAFLQRRDFDTSNLRVLCGPMPNAKGHLVGRWHAGTQVFDHIKKGWSKKVIGNLCFSLFISVLVLNLLLFIIILSAFGLLESTLDDGLRVARRCLVQAFENIENVTDRKVRKSRTTSSRVFVFAFFILFPLLSCYIM